MTYQITTQAELRSMFWNSDARFKTAVLNQLKSHAGR